MYTTRDMQMSTKNWHLLPSMQLTKSAQWLTQTGNWKGLKLYQNQNHSGWAWTTNISITNIDPMKIFLRTWRYCTDLYCVDFHRTILNFDIERIIRTCTQKERTPFRSYEISAATLHGVNNSGKYNNSCTWWSSASAGPGDGTRCVRRRFDWRSRQSNHKKNIETTELVLSHYSDHLPCLVSQSLTAIASTGHHCHLGPRPASSAE